MRAITPSAKGRVKLTAFIPNGNSSEASKACLAAATSRSASAHRSQGYIIRVKCSCEVCFAAIWTDAKCFLDGCFRCRQSRRSMVKPKEVKLVMNHRELAIGLEKRWVARHRLVQQIDCVQRILPPP